MRASLIASALTLLAATMAGCVGQFEIEQTEPLRVQIDGESQEGRVAADGGDGTDGAAAKEREFQLESPRDVEAVTVVVEVTKVEDGDSPAPTNETGNESGEPAVIIVIVEDRDDGQRLAEKRVEAEDGATQVELNIDVKGRDNVVIVTQAIEGVADVEVAAHSSTSTDTTGGNTTSASPTTSAPR